LTGDPYDRPQEWMADLGREIKPTRSGFMLRTASLSGFDVSAALGCWRRAFVEAVALAEAANATHRR